MAKDLRAIIGVKPDPKPYSLNPPKNPRAPGDAKDEDEFINHVVSGATVVPDPTGNDVSTSKIAKAKKEAPNVATKQKLGEEQEQVDEISKALGQRYIKKASKDSWDKLDDAADADFAGDDEKAAKLNQKSQKRDEFIKKAKRGIAWNGKFTGKRVDELYGKGSIEKVRDNHDNEHNDADFEGKIVKAAYHADSKVRAKELIQKRERNRRLKGV